MLEVSGVTLNAEQAADLKKVVVGFKQLFGLNPSRYGRMHGYEPETGKKLLTTNAQPLTDEVLYTHLVMPDKEAIRLGINRIGWLPSDSLGQNTRVGIIDIDAHGGRSAMDVEMELMAVISAAHKHGLIVYIEKTINNGYHVFLFFTQDMSFDQMRFLLYLIKSDADLTATETYPMGTAGPEGRWVFQPGAGALSPSLEGEGVDYHDPKTQTTTHISHGFGRTFLADEAGTPISVFEYEHLKVNDIEIGIDLAKQGQAIMEAGQKLRGKGKGLENPTAVDIVNSDSNISLFRTNVIHEVPKQFDRHASLMSWMNVARRMSSIDSCAEILKSQSVYEAWIRDGSRTYGQWQDETDRIADKFERFGTAEYGFEYGIKKLRELGWKVVDFAKINPENGKEKEGKQSNSSLARRFIQDSIDANRPIIYMEDGAFFRQYNGYIYAVTKEMLLLKQIGEWYQSLYGGGTDSVKTSRLILEEVQVMLSGIRDIQETPGVICTPNELLQVEYVGVGVDRKAVLKRIKHTPDIYCFTMVFANYHEQYSVEWKQCAVYKFMTNAFHYLHEDDREDNIRTLLQWLGYSMTNEVKAQKMLNLYGESGTGKSTYINVIHSMYKQPSWSTLEITDGNEGSGPMQFGQLANDHMLVGFIGKRAVAIGESSSTGADPRGSMVTLKLISGNDAISINPKGKKPFSFNVKAKITISSNSEFYLGEDKGNMSIWRRFVRINFEEALREGDFMSETEMHYMCFGTQEAMDRNFTAGIDGLLELYDNDFNFVYYDHDAAVDDPIRESNHVIDFCDHVLVKASEYDIDAISKGTPPVIKIEDLRGLYNLWAAKQGMRSIGSRSMFKKMLGEAVNYLKWDKQGIYIVQSYYVYIVGVYVKPVEQIKEEELLDYTQMQDGYLQDLKKGEKEKLFGKAKRKYNTESSERAKRARRRANRKAKKQSD